VVTAVTLQQRLLSLAGVLAWQSAAAPVQRALVAAALDVVLATPAAAAAPVAGMTLFDGVLPRVARPPVPQGQL
jgi:hypothetical protein